MRLTNLLLKVLIVVIAAAGVAAIVKERQIQRHLRKEFRSQQLAVESLGLAVGQLRNEEHAYFAALGHAVGMVRNEQYSLWPAVEGHLRDLDTSVIAVRNNITAIASALGVKHSPKD